MIYECTVITYLATINVYFVHCVLIVEDDCDDFFICIATSSNMEFIRELQTDNDGQTVWVSGFVDARASLSFPIGKCSGLKATSNIDGSSRVLCIMGTKVSGSNATTYAGANWIEIM